MKSSLKIVGVVLLLVILGGAAFLGISYYQYHKSPDYLAEKYFKQLEEAYRNDPYGGSTPEETLGLFIDALKKGDTDLAAKYFVIDEQKEWQETLANWKTKNKLNDVVNILQRAGHGQEIYPDTYQLIVVSQKNEAQTIIDLVRNTATKKWKLQRF